MAQQSEALTTAVAEQPGRPSDRGTSALDRNVLRSTPGFYVRAWRRLRRDRVAMAALAVVILMIVFSYGAPVISNLTGFEYGKGDYTATFAKPGEQGHLLGTDSNGRDILVRLAYGGRISMSVAILAAVFALAIGGTIGSVAGYYGGFIDTVLMRLVDVIISIPGITLLLLLSVYWRPGWFGLSVVIALLSWTGIARLVRGEVLSLKRRDYVDAARVIGASNARIIFRHIFPNVLSIVIVWISLALPGLILTEATLSYLGFGVRIPVPSWGNMLDEAYQFYTIAWTYVFFSGLAVYIAALAFNLLGNGMRDALDPRLSD